MCKITYMSVLTIIDFSSTCNIFENILKMQNQQKSLNPKHIYISNTKTIDPKNENIP